MMPVHCSNCAQDFCSEFDSGLMMDPKIVTVPLAPAYELNCAQAPVSAGDDAAGDDAAGDEAAGEEAAGDVLEVELPLPLLHAARASTEAPMTVAAATDRLAISHSPSAIRAPVTAGRYRFVADSFVKREISAVDGII